ncbi:ATP-dependent DNA helicase PIF1-like [Ipomoea triloba]|uniref:ATP-dependent DNA helicase PIF1-like n=1 Tax=Ipomoea triloba TaxID=35885 RepID=UPI00125D77B2|nr:ATP-dependent DNA helicase PIF1-like [Ipomoea triloba]
MSFRDACYARGLIYDEKEYIDAILEASQWSTANALRRLFVTLLTSKSISHPEKVWNATWQYLCEDAEYRLRCATLNQDVCMTDQRKILYGLVEVEKLLSMWNQSLKDYPHMPIPDWSQIETLQNRLILEELSYDLDQLRKKHDLMVLTAVSSVNGGFFFVYGCGGTGKTFVWRTLSAALRSEGKIVLNVASSGIASLLMPGGRTAHSRFAIPIIVNEDSMCNISQGSDLAELIIKCSLIIWDEAPMMHKHCFEALDKTMRDLLRFCNPLSANLPFGGKTVVLGGDFRQILPVIPKGSRQDIVGACVNSSYLWSHCTVLRLTKNLRLQSTNTIVDHQELNSFANWIVAIGDGLTAGQDDGEVTVNISSQHVLKFIGDPITAIVDSTFPSFCERQHEGSYLTGRAILASTLEVVDEVNEYMSALNEVVDEVNEYMSALNDAFGRVNEYMSALNDAFGRTYLSCDSVCPTESIPEVAAGLHTPEMLNSFRCSGLPNHCLSLKVGCPIMLLRNIDPSLGLCNGTRLIVSKLADHVIEAKILFGNHAGTKVLIPRLSLTPSDMKFPLKFRRKQFPVMLSYAMTINKSQGQTLTNVGLLLKKPVFVHGQLYVALSRVSHPNGLKLLICSDKEENVSSTLNIVYKEVFNNL